MQDENHTELVDDTFASIDDEVLQSVSGGCSSSCGGGFGRTTPETTCPPPGYLCSA